MSKLWKVVVSMSLLTLLLATASGCGGDPATPKLTEQDKQNIADETRAADASKTRTGRQGP